MSRTITVNVEDETIVEFRKNASTRFGKRKGYLGKAFTEALQAWNKSMDRDLETQFNELLKKGIKMKKWKFNRAELYER